MDEKGDVCEKCNFASEPASWVGESAKKKKVLVAEQETFNPGSFKVQADLGCGLMELYSLKVSGTLKLIPQRQRLG
jgi:hypothetical protein